MAQSKLAAPIMRSALLQDLARQLRGVRQSLDARQADREHARRLEQQSLDTFLAFFRQSDIERLRAMTEAQRKQAIQAIDRLAKQHGELLTSLARLYSRVLKQLGYDVTDKGPAMAEHLRPFTGKNKKFFTDHYDLLLAKNGRTYRFSVNFSGSFTLTRLQGNGQPERVGVDPRLVFGDELVLPDGTPLRSLFGQEFRGALSLQGSALAPPAGQADGFTANLEVLDSATQNPPRPRSLLPVSAAGQYFLNHLLPPFPDDEASPGQWRQQYARARRLSDELDVDLLSPGRLDEAHAQAFVPLQLTH